MRDGLERSLSVLLTASAVVIAVVLVRREFTSQALPPSATIDYGPPRYEPTWQDVRANGVWLGDSLAPVTIVEFSDLECPFCRRFHKTLSAVRSRSGGKVAFVFVHFPLEMHRFARPAARAAECAADQGRFSEFIDAIYEKQDSLGLRPWMMYAFDAGVSDTVAFAQCERTRKTFTRIDAGLEAGNRIGVASTPTVIVNGWRFPVAPTEPELDRVIRDLLAGKQPFAAAAPPATN